MEWLPWRTRWVNRNGTAFGSVLTAAWSSNSMVPRSPLTPGCSHIASLTLLVASPRLPGIFFKTAVPGRTDGTAWPDSSVSRCSLRPGNIHSADGWRNVLEPVVERYRERNLRHYFQGDAALASPDLCEFLEGENYKYVIRLKANKILQECIAHLLTRPVGRLPRHVRRYYASSSYQAGL